MPNKKKFRDITPPSHYRSVVSVESPTVVRQEEARPIRKQRKFFPPFFRVALGTLVLFIVAIGALHFFFSNASAVVWPSGRDIQASEELQIGIASELPNDVEITGQLVQREFERSDRFAATGLSGNQERSRGTIRVYNEYSTSPMTLIEETRFVSEDGRLFRSLERIVVPGATRDGGELIPGQIDVRVEAAEPGEEYNIGPSNFSIPGLAGTPRYTYVYGESSQAMNGGTSGQVTVVSEQDLQRARVALEETLTDQAGEEFQSIIPEDFIVLKDSLHIEILDASSVANEGAILDEFTYSMRVKVTGMAFPVSAVQEIATTILQNQLQDQEQLHEPSIKITYPSSNFSLENNLLTITIQANGKAYQRIQEEAIKEVLLGKDKDAALSALAEDEAISNIRISFWPFWVQSAPTTKDRINLTIQFEP